MKNLRQHPIEHLRGVIPGIRPFPDAADVFAEPVEKYARHFLPLVTIDLACSTMPGAGRFISWPLRALRRASRGWGVRSLATRCSSPTGWLSSSNDAGKYELLGDWRYFMLEQDRADWAEKSLDWREVRSQHRELVKLGVVPPFELHHEAKYSWRDVMELHYATQHAAYEQARRTFWPMAGMPPSPGMTLLKWPSCLCTSRARTVMTPLQGAICSACWAGLRGVVTGAI
jgi:hypothetical protein